MITKAIDERIRQELPESAGNQEPLANVQSPVLQCRLVLVRDFVAI